MSSRDKNLGLYNPYIDDLIQSFGQYYSFANLEKPSSTGIFDILKYIKKLDFIFFHWIEKLPGMRGGFIQTIFLFCLIPILRLFNVKIIWTMHNKLSHSGKHARFTKAIFKLMLKKSSVILTHSTEGIYFGESMVANSEKNAHYFSHPVKDRRIQKAKSPENDILIWGTISPYKGIDKFLEFLYQNKLEEKFKVLIVGKVSTPEYAKQLQKFVNNKIRIENKFIEDDDLQNLIAASNIVLFTYSKSSILSSGVLMDSLGYGANVIGPKVGAFNDLAKEGIVNCYDDYNDMMEKIDAELNSPIDSAKNTFDNFLLENTWEKYAENVHALLQSAK